MEKVKMFAFCKTCKFYEKEPMIYGITTHFILNSLPQEMSFGIVCIITNISEGEHSLSLKLFSPNEKQLGNMNYEIYQDASFLPTEFTGTIGCIKIENIVFEEEGIYKACVEIDGKLVGEYELYVCVKPPYSECEENSNANTHF